METILVTGGAGFIGSNFIRFLFDVDKNTQIVNLDALTYAANLDYLNTISQSPRYTFIKGNICDKELLKNIFNQYKISKVINFAAESHVDRSISSPDLFFQSNTIGAQLLMEAAKEYWDNNSTKDTIFIQVSTDEVYGAAPGETYYNEESPLNPSSPYASSKAAADLIALSYYKTYGFPMIITRCSNNYGPNQYKEKLIPLVIHKAMQNEPIPVYGNGLQKRDWIHVKDHCNALYTVLQKGKLGEIYNITANNEIINKSLIEDILKYLEKPQSLIKYVEDRLGHDVRYGMDCTKLKTELSWEPSISFKDGLHSTIQWYSNKIN